mmetsp:Transcript_3992/g.8582  ORF Transcript_3992/g.8582 Transcript_3992/m.8582 type:complete len:846 (+) Transcript_3992:171-2708(+)
MTLNKKFRFLKFVIVILSWIRSVSSQEFFENTGEDDPLLETWIKEEDMFANIQQKLESTFLPTSVPSTQPIFTPTSEPTISPTFSPTSKPTRKPSRAPTLRPTYSPTASPSTTPSSSPTKSPSSSPTPLPSFLPSFSSEPSLLPSGRPSGTPTATPSLTPSQNPTIEPSISNKPSSQPSALPTSTPSAVPSKTPSWTPSAEPTPKPTSSPTPKPSLIPSTLPSLTPTGTPTTKPTDAPTPLPSKAPSRIPSQSPTESPTESVSPTVWKTESTIIINDSKAKRSTSLFIVGACCFVVVASTGAYLYRRSTHHQLGNRDNAAAPRTIDVSFGKDFDDGVLSSFSHDAPVMAPGFHSTTAMLDNRLEKEDICALERDLEKGMKDIPTSVAVVPSPQASNYREKREFNDSTVAMDHSSNSMVKMPYLNVHKFFQRQPKRIGGNSNHLTWAQMREQTSPCSSGYAPASAGSPLFSPVFVKGIPTLYSSETTPDDRGDDFDEHCDQDGTSAENSTDTGEESETHQDQEADEFRNDEVGSNVVGGDIDQPSDIGAEDNASLAGISVGAVEKDNSTCCNEGKMNEGFNLSKSSSSRNSGGSSLEWNIDVSQTIPSYEDNIEEEKVPEVTANGGPKLQAFSCEDDLLPDVDLQMSYTPESSQRRHFQNSPSASDVSISGMDSVAGSTTSPLGDNKEVPTNEERSVSAALFVLPLDYVNESPTSSERCSSVASQMEINPDYLNVHELTYGNELLRSSEMGNRPINFKHVYNDPKNDLYECKAPPGSLGLVVDTTPLGLRVNSLNPLSPLFGMVASGDIIVGVDELDAVGMESGDFMEVIMQRSHQENRIFTLLRI